MSLPQRPRAKVADVLSLSFVDLKSLDSVSNCESFSLWIYSQEDEKKCMQLLCILKVNLQNDNVFYFFHLNHFISFYHLHLINYLYLFLFIHLFLDLVHSRSIQKSVAGWTHLNFICHHWLNPFQIINNFDWRPIISFPFSVDGKYINFIEIGISIW